MDSRQEEFWNKVSVICGGVEKILQIFLEVNGFSTYSSFLNMEFTEELAEKMENRVKKLKPSNKFYNSLLEEFEEPLSDFELLEGWKSSLRTIFSVMNSPSGSKFINNDEEKTASKRPVEVPPIQSLPKRTKYDNSDPRFIQNLIEKFQTKIFTRLCESGEFMKISDKSEINVTYIGEMDYGKKFEIKCLYCSSTLAIYWRFSPTGGANGEPIHPKLNECNFIKHLVKNHPESGVRMKTRYQKNDNQQIQHDFEQIDLKIEDTEW